MNFFIFIFAILGVIVILSIIYYYIHTNTNQKSSPKNDWPPQNYMRYVGSKCPDYWTLDSNIPNSNRHICKNKFNIPVNDPTFCGSDQRIFTNIRNWPPNRNDPGLKDACRWMQKCGPTPNTTGSWVGVNQFCQ